MPTSNKIVDNLDRFVRKYYKSRLIKGAIYSVALLLILFLLIVFLEHFGYFGIVVRTILFWTYILSMLLILWVYVITPILKMNRLGKVISYEEAAVIVGDHFPEIKDKLLNLLQLQKEAASSGVNGDDLLMAAIEQKTNQISPIPFSNAVDLKVNRRYLKFALVPLVVVLALLFIVPSFITEPSKRLVHHSTFFQRPAPFAFKIQNKSLEIAQQEYFNLLVSIEGDEVPNEAYINIGGNIFKMQQQDKSHYSYLFKSQQRTIQFHLQAAGVESEEYELKVYPKPTVVNFQVLLSYPAYTKKPNEVVSNMGDLTVPQGTVITWRFQTLAADTFYFKYEYSLRSFVPNENGRLNVAQRAMQSFNYGFFVENRNVPSFDTLKYAVSVITDCAPMIMAMEMRDSLTPSRVFFKGRIKDDYGFTKLEFRLKKTNEKDSTHNAVVVTPIAISADLSQDFFYTANLNELAVQPGDKVEYYFVVWDNDGIHGPKAAKSQVFEIKIPSPEELDHILDKNYDQIDNHAEASLSELKKLQSEIDNLMRKLVDKKDLNWQDKKQLEDLLKKQKEVKSALQKMQQNIQENNRLEEQYRQQSEQIMQKQQELDKLFDQLMTEEMKEMMKEIDRLMQETDKKKVQEQLENLKLKNEDVERQLDQNIELMRRLEMEKKVEEAINRIDKLAEQQRELSKQTEQSKGKDREALLKKQQQISQDFNELRKQVDQIHQEYKKIDPSGDFKVDRQLQEDIQQSQQNAQNQLNKGRNNEASKQQEKAAEQMERMSEQLAQSQMEMEQEDLAEDSEMVRRLLKNVVRLSFNQEELIKKVNEVYIQDPKYQQIINNQNKVITDFRNVSDSLEAMARRQIEVAAVINKELGNVNTNLAKSFSGLLQYNQTYFARMKNPAAAKNMQYAMTSLNNLALVMAESLDQMQNQMRQNQQQKQKGSCKKQGMKMKGGNCSNPGSGKPSPKSMKQMQDELNKQLNALKQQLDKQGGKPGRTKVGEKGSMSESFARMAAQQEQIRRMMQQNGQEMKQQAGGNSRMAKEIDEMMRQMEQTETDLVNKTITQQTIRRQQQIMTRLLEHEKAEMQREKEERRESNEAKDQYQSSPADMERFNRMKEKNLEMFHNVPPTLSTFYKNKVTEYFYKF